MLLYYLPDEGSTASFRSVEYIKYSSKNEQCP